MHTHVEQEGRVRIVDVWESRGRYESFQDSTLLPTMHKAAAGHGMDMSQAPEPEQSLLEVHGVVAPR